MLETGPLESVPGRGKREDVFYIDKPRITSRSQYATPHTAEYGRKVLGLSKPHGVLSYVLKATLDTSRWLCRAGRPLAHEALYIETIGLKSVRAFPQIELG